MPVELRDHQVEAVDAIMRGLDIPPGGKIPPHGLRAGACRVRDRQDDHGRGRGAAVGAARTGAGAGADAPAQPTRAAGGRGVGAFERGLAALARYRARTGSVTVSRSHVETLEDATEVKLGIWISNTRSRRANLTQRQLDRLAEHGLDWR